MKINILIIMLINCLLVTHVQAKNILQARLDWQKIHSSICLHTDNITRVEGDNECLVIQTYRDKQFQSSIKNLVIYIHGDAPIGGPTDYMRYLIDKSSTSTVSVVLIRPGYYDSMGNYSTGKSDRFLGDGYTNYIVEEIATAIKNLKIFYHPKKITLVGHSGGAALSALITDAHPDLVNQLLLASCPCDISSWTHHHNMSWPNSLSPIEHIAQIKKETEIVIFSGKNDTNVLPKFNASYAKRLQESGHRVTYILVQNEDHNSIVFSDLMKKIIKNNLA